MTDKLTATVNEELKATPAQEVETDIPSPQPEPAPVNYDDLSTEDKIQFLQEKRNGSFGIPNLSIEDLKYLRSKFQSDYEFTGAQQAFGLMTAFMGIESAYSVYEQAFKQARKEKREEPVIQLNAAAIHGAIFYVSNLKGRGVEQARQIFKLAMVLNTAAKAMKEIDSIIDTLKQELKNEQTEAPASQEILVQA